jgi:cytochrome P450
MVIIARMLPLGPSGRLHCTLQFMNDPVGAGRKWRAKYGKTFMVPVIPNDMLMTCEPELVRAVYANHGSELFFSIVPDSFDLVFGPRSLVRLTDDAHLRERKLIMPSFHGDRMRSWGPTMADIARRVFTLASKETKVIRAADYTRKVTLEVILRAVFGLRDEAQIAEYHPIVERWVASAHPSFIFFPLLQHDWLGLSPYARYRKLSERADALLYELIVAARAAPLSDDVLSIMAHARYEDGTPTDDQTLRDNLRTLVFAGHDSTAVILAWAIWFVHRNPAVLARLREELDALGPDVEPDALARNAYLAATFDETLRMRPINSEVQRRLAKTWQLGEWELPAGTTIGINLPLLHFDPDSWVRPEQFEPERFLGKPPSPSIYVPFGGGTHRCPGAAFARYEGAVVLGTLLREFEFDVLDEQIEWKRKTIVLEPRGGVNMRVRPRTMASQ